MAAKEPDRFSQPSVVRLVDFPGFLPNADPHDIPPGASVEQVNATSVIPGQLTVRRGFKVVNFDT